jgi:hypothetical protein
MNAVLEEDCVALSPPPGARRRYRKLLRLRSSRKEER